MGGFPALQIKAPESPLQQYAQIQQIQAGQQQLQSGQQQQQLRGQEIQSGSLDLQMKQLALDNRKITQSALTDPKMSEQFNSWQQSKGPNQTPDSAGGVVPLHPLAQFLMEQKGLPLQGPGGALEISKNFTEAAQQMATLIKTKGEAATSQLTNYSKQLDNLGNAVAPILNEIDRQKQSSDINNFKIEVQQNPDKYPPELVKNIGKVGDASDLATLTNNAKIHETVISEGTKLAEEQSAQATALQKTQAAAGIKDKDGVFTPQARSAMSTVDTYTDMPANMRAAFTSEMKNAPDFEALQRIQTRADSANESFKRSADARTQADAMKQVATGQAMAQHLIVEDKGLSTALQQTSGIRSMLDMSKGGNETATNAAQVRFAEHEIVEGGVKRMNQAELQGLTQSLGDYGRQFQAWADKGFEGQMPEATNAEMAKILDAEDTQSYAAHDRNVDIIQNRFAAISGGKIQPAPPRSSQSQPGAAPPGTVMMKAPNGQTKPIPSGQVEHYKSMGATVVNP